MSEQGPNRTIKEQKLNLEDIEQLKIDISKLAFELLWGSASGSPLPCDLTRVINSEHYNLEIGAHAKMLAETGSFELGNIWLRISKVLPYHGEGNFDCLLESHYLKVAAGKKVEYVQAWYLENSDEGVTVEVNYEEVPQYLPSDGIEFNTETPKDCTDIEEGKSILDFPRLIELKEMIENVVESLDETET